MFGVRVRVNRLEINASGGGEEMLDVIEALVKEFGHGVDLGAVTRAENDRFSNTVEGNEA